MQTYTVKQGDTLSKIAARHKIPWKVIWEHPKNKDLRKQRKKPDMLYPGDQLVIPDKQLKTVSRPSNQLHIFAMKRPKAELKLRIMLNGEPCAGTPCTLDKARQSSKQSTDSDGKVIYQIAPDLDEAMLTVEIPADNPSHRSADDSRKKPRELRLSIGHLDPIEKLTGLKARLTALGFHGLSIDEKLDYRTENVIRRFQKAFISPDGKADITGLADDQTRKKLEQLYEQDQSWAQILTDEDKLCRELVTPGYLVAPNHWNLINLINGPCVTIDGHMHINSAKCCPLPLSWDKAHMSGMRPKRTSLDKGVDWALNKVENLLQTARSVLAVCTKPFCNTASISVDISEEVLSRLTVAVAEALISLGYVQNKVVQTANTTTVHGAVTLIDTLGKGLEGNANFFTKVSELRRRLAQKLRGMDESEAAASAEVMDQTTNVSARIVKAVTEVINAAADRAADAIDAEAAIIEHVAWVEAQLATVCRDAADGMTGISNEINTQMDLIHEHAQGLVRFVAEQIVGVIGLQAKVSRLVVRALEYLPNKLDLKLKKKLEDLENVHGFFDTSTNSTYDIGVQAVKLNREACGQLPVPDDSDHLRMMMVMPMDMDFGHIDGYKGRQIYDKVEKRHGLWYRPIRYYTPASAAGNLLTYLPPDADPSAYQSRQTEIIEEKGPFYYYYKRSDNGERKKLIWLNQEEYKIFKRYNEQIKETIAAVAEHPWELMPLYNYDARRWSEDASHAKKTEQFDNQIWEQFPQAWDQPFKDHFNDDSKRLFIGFKMYTALGFRPMDPHLKHQENFYKKCVELKLPIVCHGSPAGMYTHERPYYAAYDAKELKRPLKALKKETKAMMKARKVKDDWKNYYACEHFVSPRAWQIVLKKHPDLRLCLAHFGGDEGGYTTWAGEGDIWDLEMIKMAKTYDNFYIDISYFLVKKYFDKFKKTVEDPKNRHLWEKLIFGTDWWMIGMDAKSYQGYIKEIKTELDKIDIELWYRFSWINPMRFFRIKENKDAIAKGLEAAAGGDEIKNDRTNTTGNIKIEKYLKIIEKLEIK